MPNVTKLAVIAGNFWYIACVAILHFLWFVIKVRDKAARKLNRAHTRKQQGRGRGEKAVSLPLPSMSLFTSILSIGHFQVQKNSHLHLGVSA